MLNLFRSWRCRPSFPLRHSSTISLNRASYKDNQNRKHVDNVPPTSLHGLQITSFKRQLALYLINRRFRSAEVFFHSALWESKEDHITRSQLYEHATMAFLRFGDEPRALNLFHRMTQDGFIPSHELYIVMNFLKHGSKADTDSELIDFMNWIQSLPPGMLDEAVFQPVLQIANRLVYTNPTVIQAITKKLCEERALSNHIRSLLSEFYAKKGKLDLAAEWSSTEGNISLSAQTSDEAAHISSQATSKTTHQHSISPHEFMMAKLAKKDYQGLFDSYRTWRSLGSPSILPNSLLFAVMFRTIATLESSTPRDRRPRELKLPYKMIPLRDLFYDMLECHSLQSIGQAAVESSSSLVHSRSLTTVSLTAALRSFMRVRDYAGAFIVVKSFQLFRIPLPHSIYETIVFSILHRIKRELSFIDQTSSPEDIWAYRFLNYPDLPLDGNLDLEEQSYRGKEGQRRDG
ncbi:hypothetical protein C8Q75DRAFT_513480 [Abortiporus biennis]|nr:hypothetical protein C8Q75DRAFT_513480 [Abortiporus biennis]